MADFESGSDNNLAVLGRDARKVLKKLLLPHLGASPSTVVVEPFVGRRRAAALPVLSSVGQIADWIIDQVSAQPTPDRLIQCIDRLDDGGPEAGRLMDLASRWRDGPETWPGGSSIETPEQPQGTGPVSPRDALDESMPVSAPPHPSTPLSRAYEQRDTLLENGGDPTAINARILELKRELRQGPQLAAGEFLADGRYQLIQTLGPRFGWKPFVKGSLRKRRGRFAAIRQP